VAVSGASAATAAAESPPTRLPVAASVVDAAGVVVGDSIAVEVRTGRGRALTATAV